MITVSISLFCLADTMKNEVGNVNAGGDVTINQNIYVSPTQVVESGKRYNGETPDVYHPRTVKTTEYHPIEESGSLIITDELANVRHEPNRWNRKDWFMEVTKGSSFRYYEIVYNTKANESWYHIIIDDSTTGFVHHNLVQATADKVQ